MIKGVAINYNGALHYKEKGRHADLIKDMVFSGACSFVPSKNEVLGFVLEDNSFLTRSEATEYALATKQIEKLRWPPEVYSEDLW